jgi:DNA-binding NtrC family response regulator
MKRTQVLVYESDGKLAARLQELARSLSFRLREMRQPDACLSALRNAGPTLFVLKLGRDLEREMTLLERTSTLYPATATVVVGDTDYPALASLAWDLGARFVLFPPHPQELLLDLVPALLPKPQSQSGK